MVAFDAGKRVKSRKRHLVTDTLGLLLRIEARSAAVQDRDGAALALRRITERFPFIKRFFADAGYQGPRVAAVAPRPAEIIKRTDSGSVVQPEPWVIERGFPGDCINAVWPAASRAPPRPSALFQIAMVKPTARRLVRFRHIRRQILTAEDWARALEILGDGPGNVPGFVIFTGEEMFTGESASRGRAIADLPSLVIIVGALRAAAAPQEQVALRRHAAASRPRSYDLPRRAVAFASTVERMAPDSRRSEQSFEPGPQHVRKDKELAHPIRRMHAAYGGRSRRLIRAAFRHRSSRPRRPAARTCMSSGNSDAAPLTEKGLLRSRAPRNARGRATVRNRLDGGGVGATRVSLKAPGTRCCAGCCGTSGPC